MAPLAASFVLVLALAGQANSRLVLPSAMYGENHRVIPRVVTCDADSHFDCGFEVGMKTRDLIEAAFAVWLPDPAQSVS